MPSFLSKLLGRKRTQEPESPADKRSSPTLLDGKFEAVSPTVSPSAALFTDPGIAQIRGNDKAKDKDSPFNLLRYKSRPSSDSPTTDKPVADVPHLSLTLPVTKDRGRALDVVFEPDHEAVALLNDAAIRKKRLSPNETLSLVRACSQVIIERGLDTLGIMHPHWHSASQEVQHRLISLYILSLASNSAVSPTSPTSATFESELHYTHSPHDVAAVLRWSLRHLKLDGASFGKESGDWTWYNTFIAAERTGSFPPDAFSKSLIPQLPPTHAELLLATLDIISSLAAHGEANGCSGSRLSKFLGLWLLTAEHSPESDDWTTFYDRWDRAGRILEHLFLARIRDEAHKLPRRLTELVDQYPYDSTADAWDDNLLPRPRFSTRDYDALFVRLDTEYIGAMKPKSHPLRLIADALRAQSAAESTTVEDADLWDTIKKASHILDNPEATSDLAHTEPILNFSNVFSDETIRLLSLVPVDVTEKSRLTPTFVLLSPLSPVSPGRPRSFSLPDSPRSPTQVDHGHASSSGQPAAVPSFNANPSTAPTTAAPETPTDWLQFSSQGFGTISPTRDLVATLWDNDVEVTVPHPAPLSRKSSRRAHSRRSSVDSPSVQTHMPSLPAASAPPTSKATLIARVKLNEAFVDFWADALLDPVSKPWLRFVLCQLKPLPSVVTSPNPTPTWLIIEQRFVRHAPALPPKEEVEAPPTSPRPRASSPRPSLRAETSRLSAAFSFSPKMRFGFFTSGSGDPKSPNEKSARLPQVGELGENVKETRDSKPKESDAGAKDDAEGNVASAAATAGAVAVATASAAAAAAVEEIPPVASTEDAPPALADETVPSVSAGIAKIDEPVGDQSTIVATPQNDRAQDSLIEERRTSDPEAVPASNGGVHSGTTSEPAAAQSESLVSETKPSQPALESVPSIPYLIGVSEGPIPQPEFVSAPEIALPSDEVSAPPGLAPVAEESSAPEPSAAPLVEESRATETAVPPVSSDSTFTDSPANSAVAQVFVTPAMGPEGTPEPTVQDPVAVTSDVADPVAEPASVVEEPKSADTSTLGPVPAATEDQSIPALDTVGASDGVEPVTSTFEEAVGSHAGEAGHTAPGTIPSTDTETHAQDLFAETTPDIAREQIAREEPQAAQPTINLASLVVEEPPPAEQSTPISEVASAPADESAPADAPSVSDEDGIDVAPVVVDTAETFSVAEASVESSVLKPTLEDPEHLVTSEPSVAEPEIRPSIIHDSEGPLHTNGSVQPAIEEPNTPSARVDESVVSRPAVEESAITPNVDSVEEQLANTSEPEPLVEGAATLALEETVPIVEESAHPTAIKVETPAVVEEPAVEAPANIDKDTSTESTEAPALVAELASTADAATTPAAVTPAEPPAPAAEEFLPSSLTTITPVNAEVTSETSILAPAEEEPLLVFEAAPAAETPIKSLTPVIDEPRPAPETDSPTTAEIPVETRAEELIHDDTEVTPAAEIPVESPPAAGEHDPTLQASASVGEEAAVGIPAAEVEEPVPVTEVATLSADMIAEAQTAIADEPTPVAQESIFADPGAVVETPAPTTDCLVPANEEATQAATDLMETSAFVVDESQAAAPIPAEPEVLTETLVPAAEEQTVVTEKAAPGAGTRTEEATPVPQAIVPAGFPTEIPAPVAEEPALAPEVAPNADTPAETLAVAVEAIPTAIEALPTPSETSVHVQASELSEPASAPETATHAEALPPTTEGHPLVTEDAPETLSETVPPPAEECAPPVPEEAAPATTEAVPDVDVVPLAEDSVSASAETPSDVSVPVADEPAPTLSVPLVAEVPAPVPEEPALVPEEAEPPVVGYSAETTAPVTRESSTPIEPSALVPIETPATPTVPTVEDSTLTTPAETAAPVPGELVPEESAPEAEQTLSQKGSAARSIEEQAPPAEEHLSDQSETVVAESLLVREQAVQEPVPPVDGEAPATATEEPVVHEPESLIGAETVAASVDAAAEALVSNGTGAHRANPGREPEQKPATEVDPAVTDETLDDVA